MVLSKADRFCTGCGARTQSVPDSYPTMRGGRIGYSERISDPAFVRYIKNTNRWSAIFSVMLAVAAVIGFYTYGETSREMETLEALFIGLLIGGMFLMIALYTIMVRKTSKTWDGVVVDKNIKENYRHYTGNNDHTVDYYTEYAVIVRDERGKTHRLTANNDDTQYNYFQVGDHVRHHAGLNSYEKYDKTHDSIIFCNACATLCDLGDDRCWRCNCPLLK